jgi:hypothetical protein
MSLLHYGFLGHEISTAIAESRQGLAFVYSISFLPLKVAVFFLSLLFIFNKYLFFP